MGNRTKDKKTNVWNNTQQTQSDKTEHKKTIFVGNGQTNQTDILAQKKKEAQEQIKDTKSTMRDENASSG